MTNVDFAVTVTDQGRASINKVIEGNAGYVACSESSVALTLLEQREDDKLRSLPWVGESETRMYEGGKARSKQR